MDFLQQKQPTAANKPNNFGIWTPKWSGKFAAQIRQTFCLINLSSPPNFLPDLPGILLKQHEVIVFYPRVFNT